MFLKGLDSNYALLMREAGLEWRNGDGSEIDIFPSFRSRGAGCLRVRLWVGKSRLSTLPYAMNLADEACEAGLKVQPVMDGFLRNMDQVRLPEKEICIPFQLSEASGGTRKSGCSTHKHQSNGLSRHTWRAIR